jgi:phosphoglycolate phosphatase-like HAD superfamily hydrolase
MAKPQKALLVTDLDNTLWDWVEIWYRPFNAMLIELSRLSGLTRDLLERDIRVIHQRYGTSEYAFIIEELDCLKALHGPTADLKTLYARAIDAFRSERATVLSPYPGVLDTLRELRDRGTKIVGYTESTAFYTAYRLKKTGIDQLLDCLYSPPDHELPASLSEIRTRPPEHYELASPHHHTPRGELKPNPRLLLEIIRDAGTDPVQAVYVGDSRMKDVAMAQNAGVLDVYAEYGAAHHTEAYGLLRRVSHWTDEAVAQERAILEKPPYAPSITLRSFEQLLDEIEFIRCAREPSR